jgi:TRAP-type C4-dicarboxylate transport system permease small subunit
VSLVDQPGGTGPSGPRPSRVEQPAAIRILGGAIRCWALVGGALIVALVLITAASAISNILLGVPFTGEYELAKHFVGIVIFTFLPYCQLTGANVTVDIFTEGMGKRAKAALQIFASVLALVFALVLLRQMSLGFRDYVQYPEETATLHLPLWTAFPPILVSLALLAGASLITAYEGWRRMRDAAALQIPAAPH